MNERKHMIIVKNEIKTKEISHCEYNSNSNTWDITFNNERKYCYAYKNVKWLKNPILVDPANCRIRKNGNDFSNMQEIYVFNDDTDNYCHIVFKNGYEQNYYKTDLEISINCLKYEKSRNVFKYLSDISSLSNLKNEETGEKILEKKYQDIQFIDSKLVLAQYLNPTMNVDKKNNNFIPIFPFGCNKSQYNAVKNAFENQISVIQGPPGTGKTQTILNIIANILIQGKTVQVVSNNNAAIENVFEKLALSTNNLDFLVAPLGKSENKKTFIRNQSGKYPDLELWKKENDSITFEEIKIKSLLLMNIFEKQEKLARLKKELHQLELEKKYFDEYVKESNVVVSMLKFHRKMNSEKFMQLWHECCLISENEKNINFFFKMKSLFLYGISDWRFYKQELSKIITSFQGSFYKYKQAELEIEIKKNEEELQSFDKNLLEDMYDHSMIVLKDILAKRYEGKQKREIFTEDDLWKKTEEFLKEYPIVLSTTFSSKSSLKKDVIYDYLIMDEASQVDIATGALALSCARNAVIVGDTKQLPNVITKETEQVSNMIFNRFNIDKGYHFANSFLQSIIDIIPNVPSVLLKEHYRCHPKIINFCNQKFYNDELIIMTEDNGEEDVLSVIKTNVGNHARNHYNQRQIDVIKNEIIPYLDKCELGIIAPYRNQVETLSLQLNDEKIDIATVHKFQGREKDTIIISTVDDEITDFTDDPYLLNVAISRAKKKLILVISGNEQSADRNINDLISYIQYNNFEIRESKTYSIFDYLYKQYTQTRHEYLKKYKKISEYDSENLMFTLIKEIFDEYAYTNLDVVSNFPLNMLIRDPKFLNEEECKYAMNPATHVDFLIFNKISKIPILAIEVDGYKFHKNGSIQSKRDKLKNKILELYEISYIRFSTNGSGEKEKILKKLSELNF